MDEKREIRNTGCQVTSNEESRMVEGYALLFGTASDGLPFEEEILRGALDGVLEKSDVFAVLNHDQSRGILARWKGKEVSLWLGIDEKGLKYRFKAPQTALGDELLEYIRRGEICESSFAMVVEKDTWEKRSDGTWKRSIEKIGQIFDISPVYSAAYSQTSVYMRGKEQTEQALREQEEREKEAELSAYFDKIDKSMNI